MAIAVRCSCGRQFRAKDDYAGRRTRCPACDAELVITGEHAPDHDVFISYSSKDKPVADAVCARLEERRIRCWIAPRDIRPGMDWSSAIIDAIADSAVLVLLFTGNSNQSPQVVREIERAVNKGVAVVPLRLEQAALSKSMEYFISTSHWLDAIAPPLERHLEVLVTTIKAMLARRKLEAPGVAGSDSGHGAAVSIPAGGAMPGASRIPRGRWVVAGSALLLVLCGALVVCSVAGGWRGSRGGKAGAAPGAGAPAPRPPAATVLAATAPAATVSSAGVVNLLPLIDVDADTMAGRWRFEEGHLLSDASSFARIRIRYAPPEEYDFRIEFARLAGKDDVAQIFDVQGQRSVWQMSGGLGREWGLGGRMGRIIPVPRAPRIVTGQRHVSLVRVRRGMVSAFFDGDLVAQAKGRPADFGYPTRWSLIGNRWLGLGSHFSPTAFYAAEVRPPEEVRPAATQPAQPLPTAR